jgi:hypothetical protein
MAFAEASRKRFSSRRSGAGGGKNTVDWGPRQAARNCHSTWLVLLAMETPDYNASR